MASCFRLYPLLTDTFVDQAGDGGSADCAASDGVVFDWAFPSGRERLEESIESGCVMTLPCSSKRGDSQREKETIRMRVFDHSFR